MRTLPRPDSREYNQQQSIHEWFANNRVLFLYGSMMGMDTQPYNARGDAYSPHAIADQMMTLAAESSDPIWLIIDSPGGSTSNMFMLCDTIKTLPAPVYTVARNAQSAAVWVLAAGAKGQRYVFPHAEIMIHNLTSGMYGDLKALNKHNERLNRIQKQANQLLIDYGMGKTMDELEKAVDDERDWWMTADEAVEQGLADRIITLEDMSTLLGKLQFNDIPNL